MNKITIVYYGFINPKAEWENIIYGQLTQLQKTGIGEIADIYIHITGEEEYLDSTINHIREIIQASIISSSSINQFEFPGLHLVWKLAKKNPERIYLYFHSKGMCSGNDGLIQQRQLFKGIIEPWNRILNIFYGNNHINKIGLTASEAGWMWFNFWWARGSYLIECEEPKIIEQRYYYEEWLYRKIDGIKPSNIQECYSLADDKSGICYSPVQACSKVASIQLIPKVI